jgi:hypothetical protein
MRSMTEQPPSLLDHVDLCEEVDAALAGSTWREPLVDPLLTEDGIGEEAAAWAQVGELDRERTALAVRQSLSIARGYVLGVRAGRSEDDVVAELMGTLSLSRPAAQGELADGLTLAAHPRTAMAASSGRFGLRQMRALLDVVGGLEQPLADQVEAAMLPELPGRDPNTIRERARRTALRIDPSADVRRRKEAAKKRRLTMRDAGDGMVLISLLTRTEQGLAVLHRAEESTRHDDGSGRTRDQRRADWAIEQLLADPTGEDGEPRQAAGPAVPGSDLVLDGSRRRPIQSVVLVPVTTGLEIDDEPCDLAEIGPIGADHGRLLLATSELRKACVDARTGEVLDVESTVVRPVADRERIEQLVRQGMADGAALAQAHAEAVRAALLDMVETPTVAPVGAEPQYRPSSRLSRTVKTRHPRCDFLTCRCPSRLCDDEHTEPWPSGPTSKENLAPRSRWCHRLKQSGWTPTPLPDGSTLWRSPSGREYLSPPQHEPPPPLPDGARLPPPEPPCFDDTGPPDDDELAVALFGFTPEDRDGDLAVPEPTPEPTPTPDPPARPRPNNGWPDASF